MAGKFSPETMLPLPLSLVQYTYDNRSETIRLWHLLHVDAAQCDAGGDSFFKGQ